MAPSKLRRAIGAVKDRTSIGLAKVGSKASISDLEVAIVKATRHQECPPEEKYVREILSLTCYNKNFVSACVNFLARRLNKTRCWTVALKTLMLIQRLLAEGDPAYEPEIFFATRRGTRLLNMSDFRDKSPSGSWDYSAFVRTFALYLDERLEYRMQGRRGRKIGFGSDEELDHCGHNIHGQAAAKATPVHDRKREQLFSMIHHLKQLLQRFLSCRPTGVANTNPVVMAALFPTLRESYRIYYELTEVMGVMIDRFMELEVDECIKVYEIFGKVSKQFDELDEFYGWCKTMGIARISDVPQVEKITQNKLDVMDEFIRDKTVLDHTKRTNKLRESKNEAPEEVKEPQQAQKEANVNMAASPPQKFIYEDVKEGPVQVNEAEITAPWRKEAAEVDLLDVGHHSEEPGDELALALFDASPPTTTASPAPSGPAWEAFSSTDNWETTLVQSASHLPNQKVNLGRGLDMLLLDSSYQQQPAAMVSSRWPQSSISLAFGSAGNPPMLQLPAPPSASSGMVGISDPFASSLAVDPPPYVQMSEVEMKQKLLVEQQLMWQQHLRANQMQGHLGFTNPYNSGGYQHRF
uniref:ENTH domain-containing protein n=1 Tax=Kalanchoe fedtschenkoi TaxID=63787 RepID=A0A7N0UGJ2_KALFE